MHSDSRVIDALQALRGAAALAVFLFHLVPYFAVSGTNLFPAWLWRSGEFEVYLIGLGVIVAGYFLSLSLRTDEVGRTAHRELEDFVKGKCLQKCHTAAEMPLLGLLLDRMLLLQRDQDIINMPAVEVLCRRIYGLIKAFEDVTEEADWKMPRHAGKTWKRKVKWQLLKEYDVQSLESSEWDIPEADAEVSERLHRKALFAKHLQKAESAGVASADPDK